MRKKKYYEEPEDVELLEEEDGPGGGASRRARTRQLIGDLLVRWHWMALGLVLGLLGAFYYLAKAPKLYEATSTILVKDSARAAFEGTRQDDTDVNMRSQEALGTIVEQVKNFELFETVARDPEVLALEGLIPPTVNWWPEWSGDLLGGDGEEVIEASRMETSELARLIRGWTEVSNRRKTRLVDVVVSHPIPEVACALADKIAKTHTDKLGLDRATGRSNSSSVLAKKSEEAEKLLDQKENALANYQIILLTLEELEKREATFSELDLRYLAKHPKLIAAKNALEDYRSRFLKEFDQVRKAAADKDYWDQNQAEWNQPDLDQLSRLQVARRLLTARATILTSGIESQRQVYNSLNTQLAELNAKEGETAVEVELENLSELPIFPSSPKQLTTLGAGTIFGSGLGFALAFLLVKLDNKFHTVSQVELMSGLPILATIQKIDIKVLAGLKAEKEEKLKVSDPPGMELWDSRLVFRPALLQTLYTEAYRILRASVSLLGKEDERKVSLFSSSIPGEGKTTTSANFAIAAAQQGKKTILVDFDLRKPAVHKAFGLKRKDVATGLTEVLTGKATLAEAIKAQAGQENLTVLFAGQKAPNPGELLTTEGITAVLDQLKQEFDVLVLDSAPLLAVPDTRLLVPEVDNFCLVVRAEHTPKGAVAKCLDMLRDNENEPAGIVVNDYHEKTGFARKYIYKYTGYGSYGGYGGYGQYGGGYGSGSYGSYGSYGADEEEDD
ncbi:polysaccharide biosynthesis tyrosine autokinase [Akkermansiaceae bacterium]|nr:polysaccharide biosynthesis tyrosine autokinase [Akkermansiaceae bacterium]MDA7933555.1 polysaccharide biosynthesis tyrosine autokinase [Akkermansiaceae bacterium]MDB4423437.1 polysaccharide biosynthesis tyrosine autokinase [bacterium]